MYFVVLGEIVRFSFFFRVSGIMDITPKKKERIITLSEYTSMAQRDIAREINRLKELKFSGRGNVEENEDNFPG